MGSSYSVLYKLKDYKECLPFEREHPKELRWDDKYKIFMLTQKEKCQGKSGVDPDSWPRSHPGNAGSGR